MLKEEIILQRSRGDFSYLAAILIMVVLPIYYKYIPPLMILLCLTWISENYSKFGEIFRYDSQYRNLLISFMLFFLWQVISVLYSSDFHLGWSNIFGRLSLLIFPLILFKPGARIKSNTLNLLRVFAISTLFYVISCFVYALYRSLYFINGGLSFNPHPTYAFWINYFFGPDLAYSIHPSYLAMYVLISVFISLESWYDKSMKKRFRIWWLIIGSSLFISIYFISSRAGILAAIVTISFYAIIKIINRKKSRIIWMSMIIILVLSLPLIRNNDRVNLLLQGFSKENGYELRRQDERLIVWKSAMEIIKNHPIFGVGIGDVRTELVKEYIRIGEDKLEKERLNAHNQFLEVLLEEGLVGFSFFLLVFGSLIFIAINEKNLILGLFIIMIIIFFMFETVLYRLAGVSFFSLFSFLLLHINGSGHESVQK
jgi:O-antigen ligase